MPVESPLSANDPRMVAWEQFKTTAEYANIKKWAGHDEHVEGSLWAAFLVGCGIAPDTYRRAAIEACRQRDDAAKSEALRWAAAYGLAFERHGVGENTMRKLHELANDAYAELFNTTSPVAPGVDRPSPIEKGYQPQGEAGPKRPPTGGSSVNREGVDG